VGRLTPSMNGNQEIRFPRPAPRFEHRSLTTVACTHSTNTNSNPLSSNNTSSTPYIIPTPASIFSSTAPLPSAPTSPPPSTRAHPPPLPHLEHFLLRQGEFFMSFLENSSAPLSCEPGGSASNEACARRRCNLI
jgi:hypothetical protein